MPSPSPRHPIIDLHCDLLGYLGDDPARTAYDRAIRCAVPFLVEGGVALQTLALYTATGADSVASCARQAARFRALESECPELERLTTASQLDDIQSRARPLVIAAIENASGFCDETEPLADGLARFETLAREIGPLLYVSLTWNHENRFGGGNASDSGLKDDGKKLLDLLAKKGIAIDFSHTSDRLAKGILEHIDREGLELPLLASHSNYRVLCDVPRNLPDEIASEILRRGGVIGCNAIRYFLGGIAPELFARHLRHGATLGSIDRLALGADFFFERELDPMNPPSPEEAVFVPYMQNAGAYPALLDIIARDGGFADGEVRRIAWENAAALVRGILARQADRFA